jgi:ribosomal protein S18 acetylase RimI-like enzyme
MTYFDELADGATQAFFSVVEKLTALMPLGRSRQGEHSTRLLVTGLPLPTLNGVFVSSRQPDAGEVAEFARAMQGQDVPWCIQVRGEPTAEILEIAESHGLNGRHALPLMVRQAEPVPAPGPYTVRTLDGKDSEVFAEVLAAGFEAPLEVMAAFAAPALLEAPWATGYLVENGEGEPVATGYGLRSGEHIGVFNISTPPRQRRRGYGRAATEAVMRDGFAAGARFAYLQASEDGYALYESLGFRRVETWTYLIAG